MENFTFDELSQVQRALDYFLANFDLTSDEKRAAERAYDKLDPLIGIASVTERKGYINSADEARDLAIEWQAIDYDWSYGELADWQAYFEELAERFGLTDEFRENGII